MAFEQRIDKPTFREAFATKGVAATKCGGREEATVRIGCCCCDCSWDDEKMSTASMTKHKEGSQESRVHGSSHKSKAILYPAAVRTTQHDAALTTDYTPAHRLN